MNLDAMSGLVILCVVCTVVSAHIATSFEDINTNRRERRQALDLALARLMRIQLKSKFKRDDDSDAGVDVDALHSSDAIEIPFHKRFDNAYTDFHDKTQVGQPSRMSYDPKDFAYKMSPWLQQRDRLKSKTAEEENPEVEENGVEFLANQQKRRWRSRGCDFSRVTHSQFVQFLKTGVLCGRRGYRVRFGLSGRRR